MAKPLKPRPMTKAQRKAPPAKWWVVATVPSFAIEYTKRVEKFMAQMYDPPESDPESMAIGYGHTLKGKAAQKPYIGRTLTEPEAHALLVEDMKVAYEMAAKHIGETAWLKLTDKKKWALTDFEFNVKGGLKKFPKFKAAMLAGDDATAIKEHERKYLKEAGKRDKTTKELLPGEKDVYESLKDRNQQFALTYLSEEALAPQGGAGAPPELRGPQKLLAKIKPKLGPVSREVTSPFRTGATPISTEPRDKIIEALGRGVEASKRKIDETVTQPAREIAAGAGPLYEDIKKGIGHLAKRPATPMSRPEIDAALKRLPPKVRQRAGLDKPPLQLDRQQRTTDPQRQPQVDPVRRPDSFGIQGFIGNTVESGLKELLDGIGFPRQESEGLKPPPASPPGVRPLPSYAEQMAFAMEHPPVPVPVEKSPQDLIPELGPRFSGARALEEHLQRKEEPAWIEGNQRPVGPRRSSFRLPDTQGISPFPPGLRALEHLPLSGAGALGARGQGGPERPSGPFIGPRQKEWYDLIEPLPGSDLEGIETHAPPPADLPPADLPPADSPRTPEEADLGAALKGTVTEGKKGKEKPSTVNKFLEALRKYAPQIKKYAPLLGMAYVASRPSLQLPVASAMIGVREDEARRLKADREAKVEAERIKEAERKEAREARAAEAHDVKLGGYKADAASVAANADWHKRLKQARGGGGGDIDALLAEGFSLGVKNMASLASTLLKTPLTASQIENSFYKHFQVPYSKEPGGGDNANAIAKIVRREAEIRSRRGWVSTGESIYDVIKRELGAEAPIQQKQPPLNPLLGFRQRITAASGTEEQAALINKYFPNISLEEAIAMIEKATKE